MSTDAQAPGTANLPPPESDGQAEARLSAAHPGWSVYRASGGKWYARRTGPLTRKERSDGPMAPLEADDATILALKIRAQEGLEIP
jgi:hypothetical protein